MKKNILEQFTQSKTGDDSLNEDALVITDDFIGVLDGATTSGNTLYEGMKSGRFASQVVKEAIENLPADITAQEAVKSLTQKLKQRIDAANVKHKKYPPSACLALYSRARQEIWRLGDCPFMIEDKLYINHVDPMNIDKIWAVVRQHIIHAEIARGATEKDLLEDDPFIPAFDLLLQHLDPFVNGTGPFSFGVVNGHDVPEEHIEIHPVPDNVKEIVIASDGYPELFPSFEETENKLQDILQKDPLMYKLYPQFKGIRKKHVSFDDRSYLRFIIT